MTNVYLAARYSRKAEMRSAAEQLESFGEYHVVSRWIDGHDCADADCTPQELRRFAQEDWEDLIAADALIAFTETPDAGYLSGARHVELGIALERQIWITLIGPTENIFHHLPEVMRFDTLAEYLEELR